MLIKERSKNEQSLWDIFTSHPKSARDTTTNAQMKNDNDAPMPTQMRRNVTSAPDSVSHGQRKSTTKASPPSRTGQYVDDLLCTLAPAPGTRGFRDSKMSDRPAKGAAAKCGQSADRTHAQPAAPAAQPLHKTPLACGGVCCEAEEDREASDDRDLLDDVIRDPVTLEVQHARAVRRATLRAWRAGLTRTRAGQVMRDPVAAADGHTYERAGAERWFAQHGAVSMVTGAALPHMHLVPNQASYPSLVT